MARPVEEPDAGNGHVMKNFHHPFTPYAIQETFMGTVYDVLEAGNIGILESPSKSTLKRALHHSTNFFS